MPDETVFHDVGKPDAVFAAEPVERLQQRDGGELFAVERDGHALFKIERDVGRLVGRRLGRNAHFEKALFVIKRLVGGIFEVQPLVREVPEVLVLGIVRFAADLQRDLVRDGVVDLLVSGLDVPHAPGRDDLHIRRERLDCQLEPHLIVALAGAAVADGVRPLGARDLDDALGDDRARERRAQQVVALVDGAGLEGGVDVVGDEFLAQILHIELGGAGLDCLFLQPVQLGALPDVARDGDDLAAGVGLLQPRDDDGRVQPARVGEYDFFEGFLFRS